METYQKNISFLRQDAAWPRCSFWIKTRFEECLVFLIIKGNILKGKRHIFPVPPPHRHTLSHFSDPPPFPPKGSPQLPRVPPEFRGISGGLPHEIPFEGLFRPPPPLRLYALWLMPWHNSKDKPIMWHNLVTVPLQLFQLVAFFTLLSTALNFTGLYIKVTKCSFMSALPLS